MGAQGGYVLYKLKDVEDPKLMKLIRNWFVVFYFEITPGGTRQVFERMDGGAMTLKEWLREQQLSKIEDLTFTTIVQHMGRGSISFIKKGELPGLSEDLVRLSWGDNVPGEIEDLENIIRSGRGGYHKLYYDKENRKDYYPYEELVIYPYESPWRFMEETWT